MEAKGTWGPPPMPPVTPPGGKSIDLRVGKRLLWLGEAVYPLHNLVRVYTAEFKPKRWEAFWHLTVGGALAFVVVNAEP